MKPIKLSAKENKLTGRFSTAEEAAQAKNASLTNTLKKLNLKVVVNAPTTHQVK